MRKMFPFEEIVEISRIFKCAFSEFGLTTALTTALAKALATALAIALAKALATALAKTLTLEVHTSWFSMILWRYKNRGMEL